MSDTKNMEKHAAIAKAHAARFDELAALTLFANNTLEVDVLKADAKLSRKLAKDAKYSLDSLHARFTELNKLVDLGNKTVDVDMTIKSLETNA
jgi:hypothetical protein